MQISGYSFVRNGELLDYPFVESLKSLAAVCDEVVVAVGQSDPGDHTRERIVAIGDARIRILDTVWEPKYFYRGAINSIQSDFAKAACQGDWLFYLQADEVLHERYIEPVRRRCEELLGDPRVEGLVFRFRHFWGDYDHWVDSHAWYATEIRIIRNWPQIRSWHSAQSFRYFYTYQHPHQTKGTRKLRVAPVDAEIYHYGWVRHPLKMQQKNKALHAVHVEKDEAERVYSASPPAFHYGNVSRLPRFTGTHPQVMRDRIAAMNWARELSLPRPPDVPPPRHERLRYRFLTWVEKRFFRGRQVFGPRHYRLLRGV